MTGRDVDALLIHWGDRLFYPGNRIVKGGTESPAGVLVARRALALRARIRATIARRVPQVMVKVTGGGRGMKAIAAHLRYISKNGRLDVEDERGQVLKGREDLRDLLGDWRYGGSLIEDLGHRREAFNIMLSMPRGTDPLSVQWAAREFAKAELADHKYVMVLHDHQANPHVHISVRAESRQGTRLNPRKSDLPRWRETFAEKLRERGVEAEATRRAIRGGVRGYEPLWCIKARESGRLRLDRAIDAGARGPSMSGSVAEAWRQIGHVLGKSESPADRRLSEAAIQFVAMACRSAMSVEAPGSVDTRLGEHLPFSVDRQR